MAKNVFRPMEVNQQKEAICIDAPFPSRAAVDEIEDLNDEPEYTGPTADDLRREAELFRRDFEHEKEKMISDARRDADRIVKEAESAAFEQIRVKTEDAAALKRQAEEEAEKLRLDATQRAEETLRDASNKVAAIQEAARKGGFDEGREAGWKDGRAEADRVIERLHLVLSKAIEKRSDILKDSEAQIIHLILQIAKKVVKVISENQKNIVINNAMQALQKLKNKSDIVIRVNLADIGLVTEHTKEIISQVEAVKSVTVMEDTTVDRGGCIIETDFGEIDARISSQLLEIEDRILEVAPISDVK